MKSRFFVPVSLVLTFIMLAVTACSASPAANTGAASGPIVIGYIGNINSPGTKPCMDIMQMACDDINAEGGIMGRNIRLVVEDGKGETSASVAALQRLLMRDRPVAYFIEGRSEIALALKEKSADLFPSYPHLCIVNGAADWEVTEGIVSEYDRYKFFFRDYEFAQYSWQYNLPGQIMKNIIKARKVAILYEDLIWTNVYRNGGGPLKMPSMRKYMESQGLEVVYEKAVKPRAGMWLPTLEAIAASKADVIYVYSSWYTDVEVLAKQWADSSARDIPVMAGGGTISTQQFWDMTGGKCLGMLTEMWDDETIPVTPGLIPVVKKAHARNIPLQYHVIAAYNDVLGLKYTMESAGTTTDVEALIKQYESGIAWDGITGRAAFHNRKVEPWFHSGQVANPENPLEVMYPDKFHTPWNQWQGKGNVPLLITWPAFIQYAHPEAYKSPAELRAMTATK